MLSNMNNGALSGSGGVPICMANLMAFLNISESNWTGVDMSDPSGVAIR